MSLRRSRRRVEPSGDSVLPIPYRVMQESSGRKSAEMSIYWINSMEGFPVSSHAAPATSGDVDSKPTVNGVDLGLQNPITAVPAGACQMMAFATVVNGQLV